MLMLTRLLFGAEEGCVCYASGWAYSFDTKTYYYSDIVQYTYAYHGCVGKDYAASNEWTDFFNSEISQAFRYEKGIVGGCRKAGYGLSDLRKTTKKYALEKKGDFRYRKFSIRHLYGFSASSH